jgi:hypothetical protein
MAGRFVIFIFLLFMLGACKKYNPFFTNKGVITNFDYRSCLCVVSCPCGCGGFEFHFTDINDTSRTIIENNIIQLPAGTVYPVYLTVNWQNTSRCGVKAIRIVSYELQ